jgi:hypothetical protein
MVKRNDGCPLRYGRKRHSSALLSVTTALFRDAEDDTARRRPVGKR